MKWLIHFCLCGHGCISFYSFCGYSKDKQGSPNTTQSQLSIIRKARNTSTWWEVSESAPCTWHSCHKAMCCPHFVIHSYSFRDLWNAFCGLRFRLVTGEFKWVRQVSGILGARKTKEGRREGSVRVTLEETFRADCGRRPGLRAMQDFELYFSKSEERRSSGMINHFMICKIHENLSDPYTKIWGGFRRIWKAIP